MDHGTLDILAGRRHIMIRIVPACQRILAWAHAPNCSSKCSAGTLNLSNHYRIIVGLGAVIVMLRITIIFFFLFFLRNNFPPRHCHFDHFLCQALLWLNLLDSFYVLLSLILVSIVLPRLDTLSVNNETSRFLTITHNNATEYLLLLVGRPRTLDS